MPLPLLFIGITAITGGYGIANGAKAAIKTKQCSDITTAANETVKCYTDLINAQRKSCGEALSQLGDEKVFFLNNSMSQFLDTFEKIKNVDFKDTEGLDELKRLHVDSAEFQEMRSLVNVAGSLAGGTVAGVAGGALVAFGAYGAATTLATASTGTAIATLSGAAATNATLAFFGGGSIAAGGLGIAGGTVILGGLVAAPAIAVIGFVAKAVADKKMDEARISRAQAYEYAAQMGVAALQCEAIRRRTYLFYNLLARLDTKFLPLIYQMEDIVRNEGDDYGKYCAASKAVIASCASVAVTAKSILDTPILNDDGVLTDASKETSGTVESFLNNMKVSPFASKE